MRQAGEEVAEAREVLGGFLPGLDGAPPCYAQGDPDRLELAERLRNDPRLKRVLQMAGKIERIAHKVRMVRCDDTYEEVVGIERGGDLARILPAELVGLCEDDDEIGDLLELQTLAKIAENAALQYQIQGRDRLGRGPIVMVMDESGSMEAPAGEGLSALEWAKAVALASLHTAVRERRSLALAGFDGQLRDRLWVTTRGEAMLEPLYEERRHLPDLKAAVWSILQRVPAGGTSFDAPLVWGLENGAEDDRADIIMLTDGNGYVSPGTMQRLERAREERDVRVFGLTIGDGHLGTLEQVCDEVVDLHAADDLATAVGGLGVH
jgi:uncharacterized protein with von Willebrand factor type A (vWA) domain